MHAMQFCCGFSLLSGAIPPIPPRPRGQEGAPVLTSTASSKVTAAHLSRQALLYLFSELRGQRCRSGGFPATAADCHQVRKVQFGRSITV